MIYSQLVPHDPWDYPLSKIDREQQHFGCVTGISNTPGGWDARRAGNLAASGHIAEAIGEWSRAINSYDDDSAAQYGRNLDPSWLVTRARLYLKLEAGKQHLPISSAVSS
jgi:hypothetical protein